MDLNGGHPPDMLVETPTLLGPPAAARTGRRRSAAVMANSKEDMDREPVLAKANCQEHFSMKYSASLQIAVCGLQGWRKTSEDAHCVLVRDTFVNVDVSRAPSRLPSVASPATQAESIQSGSRPSSPAPASAGLQFDASASPSPAPSMNASLAYSPDMRPTPEMDSRDAMLFDGTSLLALLGIFDGHNGRGAADFAASRFPAIVCGALQDLQRKVPSGESTDPEAYKAAIESAFYACDDEMRSSGVGSSGCTAACVLVTEEFTYLCSAGDCRMVAVCRGDGSRVAIDEDHNPSKNDEEAERLKAIGVEVTNGRVLGRLAVSRALGDFDFKAPERPREAQAVSARPAIKYVPTKAVDFIVAGCDGVWELTSFDQAIAVVQSMRFNIDGAVTKLARTSCSTVRPLNPLTGAMMPGNDNITVGAIFFGTDTFADTAQPVEHGGEAH